MTHGSFLTAGAFALGLTLTASAAFAASDPKGGFAGQIWNPPRAGPAVTHCLTWTKDAAARMQAALCDSARMSAQAMHARCVVLPADSGPASASSPNG